MGGEKRDELDQLIDTALAAYGDAEPLAGLEQRVLERVRPAGARRKAWWALAVVTAAAAVVVLILVVNRPRAVRPHEAVVGQRSTPARVLQDPRPAEVHRVNRTAPRARPGGRAQTWRSAVQRLPKRDRFPMPAPLTPEERALIQVAKLSPRAFDEPGELQPIEIAPIEIQPLRIDEH